MILLDQLGNVATQGAVGPCPLVSLRDGSGGGSSGVRRPRPVRLARAQIAHDGEHAMNIRRRVADDRQADEDRPGRTGDREGGNHRRGCESRGNVRVHVVVCIAGLLSLSGRSGSRLRTTDHSAARGWCARCRATRRRGLAARRPVGPRCPALPSSVVMDPMTWGLFPHPRSLPAPGLLSRTGKPGP